MLLPSPTWAISVLAGARSSCRGQECPYFALRQLLPTDQFEGLESPYAVLGACPLWVRSGHQSGDRVSPLSARSRRDLSTPTNEWLLVH